MRYDCTRLPDFSSIPGTIRRRYWDFPFFVLIMLLLLIGLLMVLSSSYARAYYDPAKVTGGNALYYFLRQFVFAVIGFCAMIAASHISMKLYSKYAVLFLLFVIVLLILVPIVGVEGNGARRWIGIGGFTVQPSELAKLAVVLAFSQMICKFGSGMKSVRYGIIPFVGILAVLIFLLVLEPHFSASVILITIGALMMFLGGVRLVWFLSALGIAAAGIAVLLTFFPYASSRITTWRDPFSNPSDEGYQIVQSLYSIGSGGLSGVGLGKSRQKYLYLPEEHNDFIFSVLCEELGFIGAAAILLLFSLLILRGYWIALHCPDTFSFLVCSGIISLLAIQVFLNVAVVTNLIPCTGISLPFFSYGGTALLIELFEMGIILSASRNMISN